MCSSCRQQTLGCILSSLSKLWLLRMTGIFLLVYIVFTDES